MKRDILTEIVKLEPIIVEFTLFYHELEEYSKPIWDAFIRNDTAGVISAVDLFTLNIPDRAWHNKHDNGLQELLDFTTFSSEMDKDLSTGKKKLVSLNDL